MSCADVMYQPYSPYFPYHQRSQAAQPITPLPTQGSADYRKFSALKPQAEGSSPAPSVSPPTEDKGGAEKAEAQYLSANCVLFTYYSGDISSVVDEHFARALSQVTPSYTPQPSEAKASSHSSKDGPPMSHRNFPPSFWNSNYQPMPNSNLGPMGPGALGSLGPELTYGGDPYHHHPGTLHATLHHQNDPWHYTLTGQPPFGSSYHHGAGSARFGPQYGSLLLQPAVRTAGRLGPAAAACASLEKADSWGSSRYHDTIGHVDSNYGAAYGAMTPMPDTGNGGYSSMYEVYKLQSIQRSFR
ncbi:unnamed protein product [Larinioides sclopetarius]|uniref:Transcription cofactor vestigial-like protein 2 n=1 Tax=Larinioides sclopetarius TaxID=280406 RepID=A0AAV2BKY5_9ARAC